MNHDHSQHDVRLNTFWGSRYSLGLLVLGEIALYFLLTEHRAHFFFALPFLLLLACPPYKTYAAQTPRFVPSLGKRAAIA